MIFKSPSSALRWLLLWGALKDQPFKWLIATLAIAVGVGLGLAVHLIHKQALEQFNLGVRQFSGQADLQFLPHSKVLPDSVIDSLSTLEGVSLAAPVIDLEVNVRGLNKPVRVLGLDVFTSAGITPHFIGQVHEESTGLGEIPLIDSHTIFLSPALMEALSASTNTSSTSNAHTPHQLTILHNGTEQVWTIAGAVPAAGAGQLLAVADIAAVQWKLGQAGVLSRVDLKLTEGMSVRRFREQHQAQYLSLGRFETPSEQGSRGASVSQAYRANLSILAMVALLTGGFLSFSTQMLAVAQRSRQWALLAAMGMSSRSLQTQVLFESATCGLLGGLAGVLLGHGLAMLIVQSLGVDLGGGYFNSGQSTLDFYILDALVFLGFGVAATVLGGLAPARQTGKMALAQRLRTGTEENGLAFGNRAHRVSLILCLIAMVCLLIPPHGNIPVGGYLAVAFGLFGGIGMTGAVVRVFIPMPQHVNSLLDLARSRLSSTPNLLAVGLSGVVASFALVVAMHVMIYSFRESLDTWLTQVLPAPMYLKINAEGLRTIPKDIQDKIAGLKEVNKAEFWGQQSLVLEPSRPAVELIARPIELEKAAERLPLTGDFLPSSKPGELAVWVSEPMTDIYGFKVGDSISLPLDNGLQLKATVVGVWRDYTRQHGAIVVDKNALSNELGIALNDTQGAVWPSNNTSTADAFQAIESAMIGTPFEGAFDFAEPGEIRELSLGIFDRSFAVTYLLEVAAVVIGLFGVGTTFSAMALQRKREFALLGALGASRNTLIKLIAREALIASALAAGIGLLIGLAFAAILVFVVNPQSFHWTMEWHTPWRDLVLMVLVLMLMSSATVTLALNRHLGNEVLLQLKEDWA